MLSPQITIMWLIPIDEKYPELLEKYRIVYQEGLLPVQVEHDYTTSIIFSEILFMLINTALMHGEWVFDRENDRKNIMGYPNLAHAIPISSPPPTCRCTVLRA